jgi:propanediol dehydratase large subunit
MTNKPKPTAGSEILLEAHQLVNGPRQNDYGHPADDYRKVADIYYALTGINLEVSEAIMFMVAVKLARLRTNLEHDTIHHDSLVDALGYLTCLNMAAK